jgi:hypothetical protein
MHDAKVLVLSLGRLVNYSCELLSFASDLKERTINFDNMFLYSKAF